MRSFNLGSPLGLKTTISPGGVVSFAAAFALLTWTAARELPPGAALLAGALGVAQMAGGEWLHQWGHSLAARRTGYPMTGMKFVLVFAVSQYPPDEPPLPRRIHARRALGGFGVNLLLGLALAPVAFYLWPRGGVAGWLAGFAAAWNFFVLGLSALLPIDIPSTGTSAVHCRASAAYASAA